MAFRTANKSVKHHPWGGDSLRHSMEVHNTARSIFVQMENVQSVHMTVESRVANGKMGKPQSFAFITFIRKPCNETKALQHFEAWFSTNCSQVWPWGHNKCFHQHQETRFQFAWYSADNIFGTLLYFVTWFMWVLLYRRHNGLNFMWIVVRGWECVVLYFLVNWFLLE